MSKHYGYNNNHPHLLTNSRRLFVNEATTLLKLDDDEHIAPLLDCFEEENGLYIVQDFIEGELLSASIPLSKHSQNCWSQAQIVHLLDDLLEILAFVHRNGVIHCDLKPNNIIKRAADEKFILIDFGNAVPIRSYEDQENVIPLRRTLAVSPSGYLPPEQLTGKPVPNGDIYALGIVAIQALTGLEPAKLQLDLHTGELDWQHLLENNPALLALDDQLITILRQMVRYNSAERYQSARQILEDLETLKALERSKIMIFSEDQWPGTETIDSNGQSEPLPIKVKGEEEDLDLTFLELTQGLLTEYLGPTSVTPQSVNVAPQPHETDIQTIPEAESGFSKSRNCSL